MRGEILQLVKIPQGRDLESFTELLTERRHSEAVTSFSISDTIVVVVIVDDVTSPPLSIIVEDGEELRSSCTSSSLSGNVGREIDTLALFELVDFVSLSSPSSSSSPKGEVPITIVPPLLLWTPGLLPPPPPPPRTPRRRVGPTTRITSATIVLTIASIL